MKLNKLAAAGLISLLAMGTAAAQEFDDFDFGMDDFGFGADTGMGSAVEITGVLSADVRAYVADEKTDSLSDMAVKGSADGSLTVRYSGSQADAEIVLKNDPEDVVEEAVLTAYMGNLKLEAGKMKIVWGKGDKLHVIDNFNADDYSDFIYPDYLDRRVATPMVRGSYSFDYAGNLLSNIKLEGVYTPTLPVDRFAESGRWTPAQVQALTGAVTAKATAELKTAVSDLEQARMLAGQVLPLAEKLAAGDTSVMPQLTALAGGNAAAVPAYIAGVKDNLESANTRYIYALNNASALEADASILYPATDSLKYGQAGARLTFSLGQFDLGASYYNGYYKQPSVNAAKLDSYIAKYMNNQQITEDDKFLAYDRKQTFGVEAATILWHFNVRGEAAYNLTEDTDGTDPWVHNNSVQWLAGFDIDVPLWNMNINVQETGTYVLNNDRITGSATEKADVDYNSNGYSNNRVVTNITTSFKNDQILPEVTVMYGIENGDVVVLPKLAVKPAADVTLTASGMYLWNRDNDSEFAAWKDNSFVQLGACVTF